MTTVNLQIEENDHMYIEIAPGCMRPIPRRPYDTAMGHLLGLIVGWPEDMRARALERAHLSCIEDLILGICYAMELQDKQVQNER